MDEERYRTLMRYERYGGLLLMALVWTGVLGRPLSTAVRWLFAGLLPIAQWACDGVYSVFYR